MNVSLLNKMLFFVSHDYESRLFWREKQKLLSPSTVYLKSWKELQKLKDVNFYNSTQILLLKA